MTAYDYFGNWLGVFDSSELDKLINAINFLYGTEPVVPEYQDIFKAFRLCSIENCRAVFIGQDPIHRKEWLQGYCLATIRIQP